MTARRRILVPLINPAPFIMEDVATLRTRFDVNVLPCVRPADIARCALASHDHDDLFCWFGSLRFAPVVIAARSFGARITVITGGYDVAREPSIGYGNMLRIGPRTVGRLLFGAADRVVTYSHAGTRDAIANAQVDPARIRMIYLGVDVSLGGAERPKERMVLTVSGIDATTIHRKGLLAVARASRMLPDVTFIIAGRHTDADAVRQLREAGGGNLEMPGFVSDAELLSLYERARVYAMPSVHEAFGVSLAEAMLQRCTPVVSRCGSLPEVAGDTGFYVEPGDVQGTAAAIRKALDGPAHGSDAARARVLEMFDRRRRHDALLDLME